MRFVFPRISDVRDYVITGVILLLSVIIMVARHQGGLHTLRSASIAIFSYLEEPLSSIRIYRQALQTNSDLRRQNVLLLDELSRLRSASRENEELREMLDIARNDSLPLKPVVIVGKELIGLHNSITIDAGHADGVQKGNPVTTSDGLVGKVILTGPGYSQVMPFYSTLFRVSARIQGRRAYGVVSWDGDRFGELVMKYVPQTVPVDSGQIVETSGYSNEYPANIPIGRVIRTRPERGKETQIIYLAPMVSLHEIAEAFVVTFKPDTAVTNLQQNFEELFR